MQNKAIKFNDIIEQLTPETHGVGGGIIGWRDAGDAKGRGVFANQDIPKDSVIEVSPIIPVATTAIPDEGGAPDGYLLDWDPDTKGQEHCLAGGFIMFYNHSSFSNVRLENDYSDMTITVFALRDIKKGEELVWNYDCEIWFDQE